MTLLTTTAALASTSDYSIEIVRMIVDTDPNSFFNRRVVAVATMISRLTDTNSPNPVLVGSRFQFDISHLPQNQEFVPFEQLTEAMVLSWLEDPAMDQQWVQARETVDRVAADIVQQINLGDLPPPWVEQLPTPSPLITAETSATDQTQQLTLPDNDPLVQTIRSVVLGVLAEQQQQP